MHDHSVPMYKTTKETFRLLGLKQNKVDFNNRSALIHVLELESESKVFYVQHSRLRPTDEYDLHEIISLVKEYRPDLVIMVDDNYREMEKNVIKRLHQRNYSGGGQVQGFEAHELLRSLAFAPVMIAIQKEQFEGLCYRLKNGELKGIKDAYITILKLKT